jgi:ribosomal-protein-alanine N-acetyltransferase
MKTQESTPMPLLNRSAFAEGSQIYLRPLAIEDLNQRYLGWLNDPGVTRYLEVGVFPTTFRDLETYYQTNTSSIQQVILAIVHRKSDQHIGNVRLGPINWVHRRALFGILIGEKKLLGNGIGSEATRLTVEYGFYRLNLHRIGLGVFQDNKSAVRCFEKVGFKIEGSFREEMFQDGQYKDRLWMGLLRSEYAPLGNGSRK